MYTAEIKATIAAATAQHARTLNEVASRLPSGSLVYFDTDSEGVLKFIVISDSRDDIVKALPNTAVQFGPVVETGLMRTSGKHLVYLAVPIALLLDSLGHLMVG